MPEWNLRICNEKSGFLFSHACDRLPVQNCNRCQKPICQEHAHTHESGMVCTTCARKLDDRYERRGNRHRYYDGYYGDPYFYGRPYGYGWGRHHHRHEHDPHDFTEADGEAFEAHGDADFESDLTES